MGQMTETPVEPDVPFQEPNRDIDTLFEYLVPSREQAQALFQRISKERAVNWVECDSLADYLKIESKLAALPPGADAFLYLTMPDHYWSWDLIRMGTEAALGKSLFRLWRKDLRLYLVHAGEILFPGLVHTL